MTLKNELKAKGHSQGTQLLDRAIGILNFLGDAGQEGERVSAIAEAVGLNGSTSHRIITALERHGLIERETSTKRYRLGLSLLTLGAKAADGTGLRNVCRPSLLRISAETGDTVFLMARSGFYVVAVDRQEGTYFIDSLTGAVGGKIPLGIGSGGEAILGFLPPAEAAVIGQVNMESYAQFNVTFDQVTAECAAANGRGYSLDRGRLVDGISALAVPIRPQGRDVTAALAINMTSARLPDERIPGLVELLKREATIIESVISPLHFLPRRRSKDRE